MRVERGEGAHTPTGLIQGFTGRKSNFVRRKVWWSLHPRTLSAGKPPAHHCVVKVSRQRSGHYHTRRTYAKARNYTSRHTHTQISRGLAVAGTISTRSQARCPLYLEGLGHAAGTISTVGPASGGGVAEIIGGRSCDLEG